MTVQGTTPEGYAIPPSGAADKQAGGPHHNGGQVAKEKQAGGSHHNVVQDVHEKLPASLPTAESIFEDSEPTLTLGTCILGRPEVARIVQDALLFFEGQRYRLAAWCVMPNHVHSVLTPCGDHGLSDILQSWKSFTAKEINKALGRRGTVWERESFNHLVRSPEHFERFVAYTERNAVQAGLCQDPKDWSFGSRGVDFEPLPVEFVDPRKIPFVFPRNRGELPQLEKEGGSYFVTFRLADAVVPGSRRQEE
jgi:REP element-mobilizing transposase RayT